MWILVRSLFSWLSFSALHRTVPLTHTDLICLDVGHGTIKDHLLDGDWRGSGAFGSGACGACGTGGEARPLFGVLSTLFDHRSSLVPSSFLVSNSFLLLLVRHLLLEAMHLFLIALERSRQSL